MTSFTLFLVLYKPCSHYDIHGASGKFTVQEKHVCICVEQGLFFLVAIPRYWWYNRSENCRRKTSEVMEETERESERN